MGALMAALGAASAGCPQPWTRGLHSELLPVALGVVPEESFSLTTASAVGQLPKNYLGTYEGMAESMQAGRGQALASAGSSCGYSQARSNPATSRG